MEEFSFLQLQELALLFFYKSAKEDISLPPYGHEGIAVYRINGQKDFLVGKAIEGLQDKKLITKPFFGTPEITAKGLERVEWDLKRQDSIVHRYITACALKTLVEHTEDARNEERTVALMDFVPASDRFVRLDHNSKGYRDAIASLDAVINELHKANDLGGLTTVEKEHIAGVLSSGRRLFDQDKIRVGTITGSLMPALNWLKNHLGDIAVGTLAGVAALAIGKLLGIG